MCWAIVLRSAVVSKWEGELEPAVVEINKMRGYYNEKLYA